MKLSTSTPSFSTPFLPVSLTLWSAAVLWALVASTTGCGAPHRGPGLPLCQDICERYQFCDAETDFASCVEDCHTDLAHADTYWENLSICLNETSCAFYEEEGIHDCLFDQLHRNPVASDTGLAFCSELAHTLGGCSPELDAESVEERCLSTNAVYFSEPLLTSIGSCLAEHGCQDVTQCVTNTLDEFGMVGYTNLFFSWLGMTGDEVLLLDPGVRATCEWAIATQGEGKDLFCADYSDCCYCQCHAQGMAVDSSEPGCACRPWQGFCNVDAALECRDMGESLCMNTGINLARSWCEY